MELHRPMEKFLLVSIVVMAGIGATIAPVLADLLTAAAGAPLLYGVAFALWTSARQGPGQSATTNLLKAI